MRTLELRREQTPAQWGHCHGESFRGEIQSLAQIRLYLAVKLGGFSNVDEVRRLAAEHLPVLAEYDDALYQELIAIATAANVAPEDVVVVNHYTDLRDLVAATESLSDDGCTLISQRDQQKSLLAQTWDTHATALPYVMMLKVPVTAGPEAPFAWLLSITGCLGMCGLNDRGLGVAINNLHSHDARIGVVWSAIVRRALRSKSAVAARDTILSSKIGSGHHYVVQDENNAFGIETSGKLAKVVYCDDSSEPYIHTNHCFDAEVAAVSRVPPRSTTHDRYHWLCRSVAQRPVGDVLDVWARLGGHEGYPRSICGNTSTPENPHGTATCGAIAMDLVAREAYATMGFPHNVRAECFRF